MNSIVCPNCGAAIYENEAKCPFCGYINITGAEEKFMRDMKKTESDMSQIPELQKAEYKKSMSKNSKIIFITMGIVALIAAILVGVNLFLEKVVFSFDEEDVKAQMIWSREVYPMLNEMYEAGDYEGILQFEYDLYDENDANDTSYSIYDWEHYNFMEGYRHKKEIEECIAVLDKKGELDDYYAEDIVYNCMWFHYREYSKKFNELSEEEIAILDEYREISDGYFFGRLGFTQEEADALYEEAVEYEVLDITECWKYGRKVKGRFK